MSYLTQYAARGVATLRPARRGARVDERVQLNFPESRLKLRIADCTNQIHLEFSVDSHERRENSLHKIETLLQALERFRAGLQAEAELRAARERGSRRGKEARCRT